MNCGFRLLTDFWALVLGPRRFLGSHRVLGPGPSYGPESRFSGMPSAVASETLYKNIDKNLLVTFFFRTNHSHKFVWLLGLVYLRLIVRFNYVGHELHENLTLTFQKNCFACLNESPIKMMKKVFISS